MESECTTRYPLLLVHGISLYTNRHAGNYWGRIPAVLREHGADVYLLYLDGWGSVQSNAELIKQQLLQALEQSGSERVNIITHSKGGIDTRYCLGALDCAQYVASMTSLSGPHNGSKSMDWAVRWFSPVLRFIALPLNWFMHRLGNKESDFYGGCVGLTTASMKEFNQQFPPPEGVYCQSFAAAMKHAWDDYAMAIPYLAIHLFSGKTDGLVSPESAIFADFKGTLQISQKRGISHREIVDGRRKPFVKHAPAKPVSLERNGTIDDMSLWYVALVADLKERGY